MRDVSITISLAAVTLMLTVTPDLARADPEIRGNNEKSVEAKNIGSQGGVRTHDGFLLRLMAGGGHALLYSRNAFSGQWGDLHIGGGMLSLALGGSPTEDMSLYFDLTLGFPNLVSAGVGIGGYLGSNWYIDAAFGYSYMVNQYLSLTIGKEWWVSEQWGLGLALKETVIGSLPDFKGGVMATTSLCLSATFN